MRSSLDLDKINDFALEQLTLLSATLNRKIIGAPKSRVSYSEDGVVTIVVGYENDAFIKDKDAGRIRDQLMTRLSKRFPHRFHVAFSTDNQKMLESHEKRKIAEDYSLLNEKKLMKFSLDSEMFGIPDPISEAMIRKLFLIFDPWGDVIVFGRPYEQAIQNIFHGDHVLLNKSYFYNNFVFYLWFSRDMDERLYPKQINNKQLLEFGAQRLVKAVILDIKKIQQNYNEIISSVKSIFSDNDVLKQFPIECDGDLAAVLSQVSCKPAEFSSLVELTRLQKKIQEGFAVFTSRFHENTNLEECATRAIKNLNRLIAMMNFISDPQYFTYFRALIGEEWTFSNPEEGIKWYEEHKLELTQAFDMLLQFKKTLKTFKAQTTKLKCSVELRLNTVQTALKREQEQKRMNQEAAIKKLTPSGPAKQDESSVPQVTSLSNPYAFCKPGGDGNFTKECKRKAKESLTRHEIKDELKKIRNPVPAAQTISTNNPLPDCYFTLAVTRVESQESFEIDISSAHKIDDKSEYYPLDDYKYVIVKGSPIEESIDERYRNTLIASQGRRLLSADSEDQEGMKLFCSKNKGLFGVIKTKQESRVLCYVHRLFIASIEKKVDLFIPVFICANHKDYEDFVNKKDPAAILEKQFDKALLIVEGDSSYMTEGLPHFTP